jgi:hypothetical protein
MRGKIISAAKSVKKLAAPSAMTFGPRPLRNREMA